MEFPETPPGNQQSQATNQSVEPMQQAVPPQQQQYCPPPGSDYGQGQPGWQPGNYAPPPGAGYAQYGYQPHDANTSGMGEGYPVPPSVKGWTFAGFIPYGIFAFANGNVLWGVLGIVANFFGLGLVYVIVLGIMGREIAWKSRRFASLAEFEETMAAWSKWGIFVLLAGFGLAILVIVIYAIIFASMFSMFMTGMH